MLLLFAALVLRGEVPDGLREAASNLLQYLMLQLIPAVVGVMIHFERVGREWLPTGSTRSILNRTSSST